MRRESPFSSAPPFAVLTIALCGIAQATEVVRSVDRDTAVKEHSDADRRFDREQWGLEQPEWDRYLRLLRGMRGSVSPSTLSPVEVLGIHAETDRERAEYARRWAKMMREDTERILAFQRAYDAAWREIAPSPKLFDPGDILKRLPKKPEWVKSTDRVLLFARVSVSPKSDSYIRAVKDAQAKGAQVDIFVVGATDAEIRDWATNLSFDPNAFKTGKLTLNHERGELGKLLGMAPSLPKLLRIRDKTVVEVEP